MEGVELMPNQVVNTNFWRGKKVLLTGHTGFKGSWLGLWLSELGAQVTGMGLKPDTNPNLFSLLKLKDRLLTHHIADIRDIEALKTIVNASQPEIVLHLAAQPLVRHSYVDPLGTWSTNVLGSLNLLEALKHLRKPCSVVIVTTDKVYANQKWNYGYRESDRLGGHDPYSASKAATELAVTSWRSSFCGSKRHQNPYLSVATARAGNVIGGGDWASDRIVPDAMRALASGKAIELRNPQATRPWQHVLEPLSGYLRLAEKLSSETGDKNCFAEAFNFGPKLEANQTVQQLVEEITKHWDGTWRNISNTDTPHEEEKLHLQIDKAHHQLGWDPRWSFRTTVERTVKWYKTVEREGFALKHCIEDITAYQNSQNTTLSLPND